MNGKKIAPVVALAAAGVASLIPAQVQEAEAAATITELVIQDGESNTDFTFSYEDFSTAMIFKNTEFYNYFSSENPKIQAIGIGNGQFVDYETFSTEVLFSGEDAPTVLENLAQDSSNLVPESEVNEFSNVKEWQNGQPVFADEVVPEVISID